MQKRLKHKGECMCMSMNSVNMLQKAEASVCVWLTMSAPFPHCPLTVLLIPTQKLMRAHTQKHAPKSRKAEQTMGSQGTVISLSVMAHNTKTCTLRCIGAILSRSLSLTWPAIDMSISFHLQR